MALPCNATPPHIRQQCIDLAREGKRIKEIAAIIGRANSTVLKILDEAGIARTFRTLYDRTDAINRCADLVKDGMPVKTAARETNEALGLTFAASTYIEAMTRRGVYRPKTKTGPLLELVPAPAPVKDHVRLGDFTIRKAWQRKRSDGQPIPPVSVSAGMERCA